MVNIYYIFRNLILLFSPKNAKDTIERLYFVYSFGYLITRTVAVCIITAEVDFAGKEPIETLVCLPQSNEEVICNLLTTTT